MICDQPIEMNQFRMGLLNRAGCENPLIPMAAITGVPDRKKI